jgi:hypothetical protein
MAAVHHQSLSDYVAECIRFSTPPLSDSTPHTWAALASLQPHQVTELTRRANFNDAHPEIAIQRFVTRSHYESVGLAAL